MSERMNVARLVSHHSHGALLWNAAQTFSPIKGQTILWTRKLFFRVFPLVFWNMDQRCCREIYQCCGILALDLCGIFHGLFHYFVKYLDLFSQADHKNPDELFPLTSAKSLPYHGKDKKTITHRIAWAAWKGHWGVKVMAFLRPALAAMTLSAGDIRCHGKQVLKKAGCSFGNSDQEQRGTHLPTCCWRTLVWKFFIVQESGILVLLLAGKQSGVLPGVLSELPASESPYGVTGALISTPIL